MNPAKSRPFWILSFLALLAGCDRPAPPPSARVTAPQAEAPVLASAPPPASALVPPPPSAAPSVEPGVVTFDTEPAGAPSPSFEAVVGDWYVAEEAGAHGFMVDGGKWRSGTPSASLADQAKRLYGDRYAEFLDGVKAFAFFPLAVSKTDPPAGDVRLSVRFYPIAGSVDQAAGIAFGVSPNGTYLGIRANALENNMLYFRVVKGKRTVIDDVRNVPTPTKTWHTLTVELRGPKVTATLDGQKRFEKTLDAPPSGKVGLWSKADSRVLFDDFRVEAASGY